MISFNLVVQVETPFSFEYQPETYKKTGNKTRALLPVNYKN